MGRNNLPEIKLTGIICPRQVRKADGQPFDGVVYEDGIRSNGTPYRKYTFRVKIIKDPIVDQQGNKIYKDIKKKIVYFCNPAYDNGWLLQKEGQLVMVEGYEDEDDFVGKDGQMHHSVVVYPKKITPVESKKALAGLTPAQQQGYSQPQMVQPQMQTQAQPMPVMQTVPQTPPMAAPQPQMAPQPLMMPQTPQVSPQALQMAQQMIPTPAMPTPQQAVEAVGQMIPPNNGGVINMAVEVQGGQTPPQPMQATGTDGGTWPTVQRGDDIPF